MYEQFYIENERITALFFLYKMRFFGNEMSYFLIADYYLIALIRAMARAKAVSALAISVKESF